MTNYNNNNINNSGITAETTAGGKRRVSFSIRVLQRNTLHCNDFSDEEFDAYWFCTQEYDTIKGELQHELQMTLCGYFDENKHSARGLEYQSLEGSQLRATNKRLARDSVLEEQERQRKQLHHPKNDPYADVMGPELLARVYRVCCHCSQVTAELLGRADASDSQNNSKTKHARTLLATATTRTKSRVSQQAGNRLGFRIPQPNTSTAA